MTWISDLAGQQRMIVLENLNWLYATRDKTWSNLDLLQSLRWVKESLIKDCVKFGQVLPQIWAFFIDCKHLSAICK